MDINKMILEKLVLYRKPSKVNDMYRKTFKLSTDRSSISGVENMLNRFNKFTEIGLISNAPDIIKLSTDGTVPIKVENGWNQDRLSFIMSISSKVSDSKTEFYFLTGYTNKFEDRFTGEYSSIRQMDPTMKFIINSMTTIEELRHANGEMSYKYVDEITLVKNNSSENSYDDLFSNECLIRPIDVITNVSDFQLYKTLSKEVTEVNRSNINPLNYIGSLINNIQSGAIITKESNRNYDDAELSTNEVVSTVLTIAEQEDATITKNRFILELIKQKSIRDEYDAKPDNFNVTDLLNIFGVANVDSVTKMLLLTDMTREKNSAVEYANYSVSNILLDNDLGNNLQPSIENLIAMEFYYIVSTEMFSKKITKAIMTLSNHRNFHSVDKAETHKIESGFHQFFASVKNSVYLDTYLKNIVLPKLTKHNTSNQISVNIIADIDLLGKSSVVVTVEGGHPNVFRYNSTMDNTFTPMVTTAQGVNNASAEIATLIDGIFAN